MLNSRFTDDGIVEHRRIHIGMAVRDSQRIGRAGDPRCGREEPAGAGAGGHRSGERARTNQLSPDEVVGGTFTVTNHGTGGSLIATPIINQPQAGILGDRRHRQTAGRAQRDAVPCCPAQTTPSSSGPCAI